MQIASRMGRDSGVCKTHAPTTRPKAHWGSRRSAAQTNLVYKAKETQESWKTPIYIGNMCRQSQRRPMRGSRPFQAPSQHLCIVNLLITSTVVCISIHSGFLLMQFTFLFSIVLTNSLRNDGLAQWLCVIIIGCFIGEKNPMGLLNC